MAVAWEVLVDHHLRVHYRHATGWCGMVMLQSRWRRCNVMVPLHRRWRGSSLRRHGALLEGHRRHKTIRGARPIEHGHSDVVLVEYRRDATEWIHAVGSSYACVSPMPEQVLHIDSNLGRR